MDTIKIYLNFKMNNVINYIEFLTNGKYESIIKVNILKNCIYESLKMYIENFKCSQGRSIQTLYEYSAIKDTLRVNGFDDQIVDKKDFDLIANSLYIGLILDESIVPIEKEKANIEELLTHFVHDEFKCLLKGKKNGLKKLYNESYKKNLGFIKETGFKNNYEIIQSFNESNLYYVSLDFNLNELDKYRNKVITRVINNPTIKKDLFKVSLTELNKKILIDNFLGVDNNYLINIPEGIINNKQIINYIIKTFDNELAINHIILKFEYHELSDYLENFILLKNERFKIALNKNDVNYSKQSLSLINYAIARYSNSDKMGDFCHECTINNVKTIIIAVDNLDKINDCDASNADYYYSKDM